MRTTKYNNKKTFVDGIEFSSKKEAQRYKILIVLLKTGNIRDLKLQPEFVLQESFFDSSGKKHRSIIYRADFEYLDADGKRVIEDVKGFRTDTYKIKKKLFLKQMPPNAYFLEL